MSKRAVIYARVSTDEQAEKGYSLQSQIEACRRYADMHSLEVASEITDDYSGAKLDRPGLDQLRDMTARREVDAVIVYASDRWTRNLAHKLMLRDEMQKAGVEMHYVNRGKSENTPESRMTESIESVFDDYWREKIIEGCRRGKNTKAKSNKPVMSGYPSYGYRRIGKGRDARFIINEEEALIVREIFDWYVRGDGSNGPLSLRAIAAKLEKIEVPTPHQRSNVADHWLPGTVRGILTNELYVGRTYYGKTRTIDDRRIKQTPEQWIPIDAPELAIVESGVFEAVQNRAKRNRELAKRNQKRNYLMTGHFRCGACNSIMAGGGSLPKGQPTIKYRCGYRWEAVKYDACPNRNRSIVVEKVDTAVWDWLADLLKDDHALIDGIRAMRERSEAEIEPKQRRLEQVDIFIDNRRGVIDRLISELGDEENDIVRDALKARVKTVSKEIESLTIERDSLFAELSQRAITPELEAEVVRIAAELREELDEPDFETKRYLLDKLNVRVVFQANDTGRWLDVKCEIAPDWESIMLHSY